MRLRDLLEKIDDTKLDYHDELNPKLWTEQDGEYLLKAKVKQKLVKIADEFVEALGIPQSQVKDYVITGSNANYNWTNLSDLDLHVIIDMKDDCEGCKIVNVSDCINTKKSLWNDRHDITIYGLPVELYASDLNERIVGDAGVFSILEGRWLRVPERKNISMDSRTIKAKADDLAQQIDDLIDSNTDDKDTIKQLTGKISNYRKAGLAKGGEFSVENLVWKALRNNGYIDKLRKYAIKAQDHTLSLEEALDTNIDLKIVHDSESSYDAKAKVSDNVEIEFGAERRSIQVNGRWVWDVAFSDTESQGFALTGKGSEFKAMAAVKKAMEDFIQKHSPDIIKFTAAKEEKSRVSVYKRMLERFLKEYSFKMYDNNDSMATFKLEKK